MFFFVLAELDQTPPEDSRLTLTVRTLAGESVNRDWPVVSGSNAAAQTLRVHERAMRLLISSLSPRQVRLLAGFFEPPLVLRSGDLNRPPPGHGMAPHLPVTCLLGARRLVVAGVLRCTRAASTLQTRPRPRNWTRSCSASSVR